MKKFLLAFAAIGIFSTALHVMYLYDVLPPALTYSDVALFSPQATAPGWFYLDKNIEYPILTGLFVQLMGLLSFGSELLYVILSSLTLTAFGAVATYYLYQMLPEDKKSSLWVYWVLAPSMIIFMTYNFDMLVLCEIVIAFYLMRKDRSVWAAVVLALAVATKFYPLIYLPLLLAKQTDWRRIAKIAGAFTLTTVVINIFFMLADWEKWAYFYQFSNTRGYNPDSIWTVLGLVVKPWLYDITTLNAISILVFSACFLYLLRKYRNVEIILLCFWATLLYALFTKIFSPQHILWLLPFFVLFAAPSKRKFYGLEITNSIIIGLVLFFTFSSELFLQFGSKVFLPIEILTVIRWILLLSILVISVNNYENSKIQTAELAPTAKKPNKIMTWARGHKHLVAAGIFIVTTIVMTWPLALRMQNSYPSTFASFGGDPNMYVSYLDLVVKKFQGQLPIDLNKMVFYPDGVNLSGGYEAPIMFVVGAPVVLLTNNPILAYNIILLLAFVLTALTCYFLILYLTKSFYVSLITGFSFGFSTYMVVRGVQHLDLLFLFTVPLMVLTALKFLDRPDNKNILFLSLSVLLTALSAWYYLVGGIIFMGLVFLVNYDKFRQAKKQFVFAAFAVGLSVLLPALPIIFNKTPQIVINADVIVDRAGAQPLSFILPHPFTMIWGTLTDGIYKNFPSVYFEPYPYFEQTSYFGVIGLVAVIVLIFFRKKIPVPNRVLWVSTFLVFMILALGNFVRIGHWEIPLPFAALHELFPFNHMRAPNRFFVFSYMAATIIFAYSLVYAKKYIQGSKLRMVLGFLLVLVLFTERFVFPYPTVALPVSQFYKDIGKDKANYAIVDLPIARTWGDSSYNYFQIFHKKPIVGGEYFWTAYDAHTHDFIQSNTLLFNSVVCRPDLSNLDREKSLSQLAENNIRYVVVHNLTLHEYKDCPDVEKFIRNFFQGQERVFSDGEITVYSTIDKLQQ